MKANRALVAWTPASIKDGPKVKVGELLSRDARIDWTDPYLFTGGAAYASRRTMSTAEQVASVFIDFHTMVVRDGVLPEIAHREFLKIDEYRHHIAPDIKGAAA
jgi:hypothetical protein